jgi:hypothetical protein
VTTGAQVTAGGVGADALAVDEALTGFIADGTTLRYAADTGAVRALALTPTGKRAYKTSLALAGLAPETLAQKLEIGLESGDVCARATVRCKPKGATVSCR